MLMVIAALLDILYSLVRGGGGASARLGAGREGTAHGQQQQQPQQLYMRNTFVGERVLLCLVRIGTKLLASETPADADGRRID